MKKILLNLVGILLLPFIAIDSFGITWYCLPALQETFLGKMIPLNSATIFWLFIGSLVITVIFTILLAILNRNQKAKICNFYTHLYTIISCLVIAGLTIFTFVMTTPITTEGISIGNMKKIWIALLVIGLVLIHILSSKIERIVNRRIQAYENAKESNVMGRGNVILTNILKLLEVIFPEILMLILLSLLVSWDVSAYFIMLLTACIIPVIGNIICDFNTRGEIARKLKYQHDSLVNDVANKIKENR